MEKTRKVLPIPRQERANERGGSGRRGGSQWENHDRDSATPLGRISNRGNRAKSSQSGVANSQYNLVLLQVRYGEMLEGQGKHVRRDPRNELQTHGKGGNRKSHNSTKGKDAPADLDQHSGMSVWRSGAILFNSCLLRVS